MWTSLLVLLFVLGQAYGQQVTVVMGAGGDPCADGTCLAGRPKSECIDGQCVCENRYPRGWANFACYRANNVFAEVKNDPRIRNFNNETAAFNFPCRYLMTSVTTELRIEKTVVGSCTCQLHFWNEKDRGKLFVGGYDFACDIQNQYTGNDIKFSIRKHGTAADGQYTYSEFGVNDYLPDGPWTATPVDIDQDGVQVKCVIDENNFARVDILQCGLVVGLRAYDTVLRINQPFVPGGYVGVNCARHPVFHDHDRVMATAPVDFGGSLYQDITKPGLNIPQSLICRGFTANVAQNQPDAPPQCSTIGGALENCIAVGLLPEAADRCFWILDEPRFMRCVDLGSDLEPVLALLEICINVQCAGVDCQDFIDAIAFEGCTGVTGIPILTEIVGGDC